MIARGLRITVNIKTLIHPWRGRQEGWEAVLLKDERTFRTCGHLHPDRAGAEQCAPFNTMAANLFADTVLQDRNATQRVAWAEVKRKLKLPR